MNADPYVYPGTDVLRNTRDIRDPDELRLIEADLTRVRALRIAAEPIPGGYDLEHLRRFHGALFGGLYDWAGKLRTVTIAKDDLFCLPQHLESYSRQVFTQLARDGWLRGLQRGAFIDRLAHHLANVNALHPFRDGNGRAQRAFFSQLAVGAGYDLHWQLTSPAANNAAAAAAMQGDEHPLRSLLDEITSQRGERPPGTS